MSQYFEFQLAFNLKEDVPEDVIEAFQYLTNPDAPLPKHLPDDDWFRTENPRLIGFASTEPNCGENVCSFRRVYRYSKMETDHYQFTFHFRCLWHDDGFYHDWWRLAPWLAKYADAHGFVGYYRKEYSPMPTLLYFKDGQVYLAEATETPSSIIDGKPWDQ